MIKSLSAYLLTLKTLWVYGMMVFVSPVPCLAVVISCLIWV